jgi:Protein of unknown function (DUF2786)
VTHEGIIQKVRGLLRLSQSSNVHEAAAAAAAADRLIQQHRLDETAIEIETGEASESATTEPTPLRRWQRRPAWQRYLIRALCDHYDVAYSYQTGRGVVTARMWGRPSDMALVQEMLAYTENEIERLVLHYHGATARRSFRLGAVYGFAEALKASKQTTMAAQSSTALVLASRADAAEGAMRSYHGKPLRRGQPPRTLSVDAQAFMEGEQAGRRMDLNPGKRLPEDPFHIPEE